MADPDFELNPELDPLLDPERLTAIAGRAKRQIRQRMRATRQAYPAAVVAAKSQSICERLLEFQLVSDARSVALFAPIAARREVDLGHVTRWLWSVGKGVYFPFMDPTATGFRTGFRRVESDRQLAERGQQFLEPPVDAPEAARGDIDVVIVPALAVAADGHRLGYGVGYYDATLPDVVPPATTVVVTFDFQLLAELPHERHDLACDWIVTDARTLKAQ